MSPSVLRPLLLPLLVCLAASPAAGDEPPVADTPVPRIALIIDDLGYRLDAGRRVIALPGPVACAVLPATPRGRAIAELAAASGKEVLLHLPLAALNADGRTEPGAIHLDMTRRQFGRAFAESLASVPHAAGVNNHRGSLLTRHPGHMGWLMEELRAREPLWFVDSYTTHHSIALDVALESGIPAVRRDVFLDNDRDPRAIRREFERLIRRARRRGAAVGIGHPYPETLAFLESALPRLAGAGIELVPVVALFSPATAGAD